ncbi:electron transfer flavoprotein subunit beta/FixA family protein [Dactylosporangium sp. CA-139066]|uniref:electron transfer flavoprotein subunit beta/FixA family protein n=1 Tax=Dactylosporangium sp. CA-139066 TaxID=3239930 RepID=UPI003D8DC1DC
MRIVVLVKHVPAARAFGADGMLRRVGPGRLNEADEYAVDQALRIARRRRDVQITAVTMGPAPAAGALRRALVLGADDAVHVRDERLRGCDALATGRVLAAAAGRLGFDLVLCGTASADSGMGAVPAMVAEFLGVPALCFADALRVRERRVEIGRDDGGGLEGFAAALPVVVSVTERCGEPGQRAWTAGAEAAHKLVRTWTLDDLGVAPGEVGRAAATTVVRAVTPGGGGRDHRLLAGDPAAVAAGLADFLEDRQFV